jgi:hypothetical protein
MRLSTLLPTILSVANATSLGGNPKLCRVPASGTNVTDDAPAIRSAFAKCNHGGKVVFNAPTYYVNSVLNITGLDNIDVDVQGKLLVCLILFINYATDPNYSGVQISRIGSIIPYLSDTRTNLPPLCSLVTMSASTATGLGILMETATTGTNGLRNNQTHPTILAVHIK